jgi:hypothetical protein
MVANQPETSTSQEGPEHSVRIKSLNPTVPSFDGTNPEDLLRLVTLTKLELAFANSDCEEDKCAWLCQHFSGAALDWLENELADGPELLTDFEELVAQVKANFGITEDTLRARYQVQFDALRMGADWPSFLSEFDRLTRKLHLVSNNERLQLLRMKLPASVLAKFAEQGLLMVDYAIIRDRLLTMHALNPAGQAASGAKRAARPKCGTCGKKGHTAAECRSGK